MLTNLFNESWSLKTVIYPWKVVEICLSEFVQTIIEYSHVSFYLLMKWRHGDSKSICLAATRLLHVFYDGHIVKPRNHNKK